MLFSLQKKQQQFFLILSVSTTDPERAQEYQQELIPGQLRENKSSYITWEVSLQRGGGALASPAAEEQAPNQDGG